MKKSYKKPEVAIVDFETGKVISNSPQMEAVLRDCGERQPEYKANECKKLEQEQ